MTERYSREEYAPARPTPHDVPAFVPYACSQLQAPFSLRVIPQLEDEYVSKITDDKSKKLKAGKSMVQATSRTFESPSRTPESAAGGPPDDDETVAMVAVHDAAGRLVELRFRRARAVPRLLLQVLAMCAPYQPLLDRLVVRWSPLDGGGVHEIAKLLTLSHITEICLDDSPVPQRNYDALLEHPSQLRSLSLARCNVDDGACAALAARLRHPLPAARSLALLSLSGNRVGDAGAAALARALRSNRALRYLNLNGNLLTDEGAVAILRTLMEFPLTAEELVSTRRRQLEYLRGKEELYRRCYEEVAAALAGRTTGEAGRARRRAGPAPGAARGRKSCAALSAAATSSADVLAVRAQLMVADILGPFTDPFSAEETVVHDEYLWSLGNTTLCALNLAYNNLGYASVAQLERVLRFQEARAQGAGAGAGAGAGGAGAGLVRVHLDGNALPATCRALAAAQDLLEKAISWKLAKPPKKPEKTSAKTKSK